MKGRSMSQGTKRVLAVSGIVTAVLSLTLGLSANDASVQSRIHSQFPWSGVLADCQPWSVAWLALWVAISAASLLLCLPVVRTLRDRPAVAVAVLVLPGSTLLFWVVNTIGALASSCQP